MRFVASTSPVDVHGTAGRSCGHTPAGQSAHDAARPQRALVDEGGVALEQRRRRPRAGARASSAVVMPPTPIRVRSVADPGAQQPQRPPATRSFSGRPRQPAGADRLDRRRRRWRRPSRLIVVLVAMMPSRPSASGEVGDGEHVVVGEVGGDLDQQRHPAVRATSSARRRTAASSGSSFSTACRSRRPGVFGEETLTTR